VPLILVLFFGGTLIHFSFQLTEEKDSELFVLPKELGKEERESELFCFFNAEPISFVNDRFGLSSMSVFNSSVNCLISLFCHLSYALTDAKSSLFPGNG
jgi:hypothetical protein